MKIIKGNLIQLALDGHFDVIIHGCNCFCTMGKGIAKIIKEVFPEAYNADLKTSKGDIEKLGCYSSVTYSYGICINSTKPLTVINAYVQYHYGSKGDKVDYTALANIFRLIKEQYGGKRIGYPRIGAGLAGGNWDKISKIIDENLEGEDHILVEFDGSSIKCNLIDRSQKGS
jgi:O-acetyl-ADP-ribose deacetylase (regulator of RNase III)